MALPATHIRFADAVADRFRISDRTAYFSGTLYPDSRWVTGLEREKTHSQSFLDPGFVRDDFTLGWRIHLVCDQVQQAVHEPLMGDLASLGADDRWVRLSAAKVVQDMRDAAWGGLAARIPLLTHAAAPNGEDSGGVAAYLGFVRHAYRKGTTPAWSDYAQLWTAVGLDRAWIDRIARAVAHIRDDGQRTARIEETFVPMVAMGRQTVGDNPQGRRA